MTKHSRRSPGPHEQWLIEHAPHERPAAIAALATGRDGVIALAQARAARRRAGHAFDRADVGGRAPARPRPARARRSISPASSSTSTRTRSPRRSTNAGARLVSGPFPGTDYYVHGDWCLVQTIAQLERQGARRLRDGELEGI